MCPLSSSSLGGGGGGKPRTLGTGHAGRFALFAEVRRGGGPLNWKTQLLGRGHSMVWLSR